MYCRSMISITIRYNYHILSFNFFYWLFFYLSIFFFLKLILLRIISWRYLNNSIHNHVKIWFLFSCFFK